MALIIKEEHITESMWLEKVSTKSKVQAEIWSVDWELTLN